MAQGCTFFRFSYDLERILEVLGRFKRKSETLLHTCPWETIDLRVPHPAEVTNVGWKDSLEKGGEGRGLRQKLPSSSSSGVNQTGGRRPTCGGGAPTAQGTTTAGIWGKRRGGRGHSFSPLISGGGGARRWHHGRPAGATIGSGGGAPRGGPSGVWLLGVRVRVGEGSSAHEWRRGWPERAGHGRARTRAAMVVSGEVFRVHASSGVVRLLKGGGRDTGEARAAGEDGADSWARPAARSARRGAFGGRGWRGAAAGLAGHAGARACSSVAGAHAELMAHGEPTGKARRRSLDQRSMAGDAWSTTMTR